MSEIENPGRLALLATADAVRLKRMADDQDVPRAELARAAVAYVEKTSEMRKLLVRASSDDGVSLVKRHEGSGATRDGLDLYVKEIQRGIAAIVKDCESHIERSFLSAWLSPAPGLEVEVPTDLRAAGAAYELAPTYTRLWCHLTESETKLRPKLPLQGKRHAYSRSPVPLWLVPQYDMTIEGHAIRVDFAVIPVDGSACSPIAVELDGHQWHERTPAQATADKARDRAMKAAGWTTLRFTGSEMNADPGACVDQVRLSALWDTWRSDPSTMPRAEGAAE